MENASQALMPEEIEKNSSYNPMPDLRELLDHLDHVTARAELQSTFFHQVLSQTFISTISLEIIAIITAKVIAVTRNQNSILVTFTLTPTVSNKPDSWSKKFPDIPKYNSDIKKLDAHKSSYSFTVCM